MNIGRQSRKQVRKAKARARGWELRLHPRVLGGMPLAIVGVTLVVYLLTMAPRYTWGYEYFARDGGDFVSAAWNLGVPHPTGYPTYTLLAWLFTRLPWGAAVWRVQLLSGLAGAGTVLLVYHMVRRLAAQDDLSLPAIGAASGAFLLAFARLFWSHSLVVEVYALHLFFIACVLWLMLRWRDGQGPLWLAALVFGLGMGNHSTLTFAGPAMLLLLWDGRKRLAWREVIAAALALAAGLLVYLYLPWRAAANPIVNWGDPDTWAGFRWVVTGEGYQRFFFALPAKEVWPRLQQWGRLTGVQFPILAWPLALMGFWSLGRRDRWLAMGTLVHAAINLIYSIGYDVSDAFVHLLPVYFYAALWMGVGAVALLSVAHEWRPSLRYPGLGIGLVVAGLFLLPGFSLVKE